MFGCLRRLGCLVTLVVLVAAAWLTRDYWYPGFFGRQAAPDAVATWEPVAPAGAERARSGVESLGRPSGPAFVNLEAADLAALILAEATQGGTLPASIKQAEASVSGEQVLLRGRVELGDLKGLDALGPFANFLNKEEPFTFGGTVDVIRPGLAEYRVVSAQIGTFPIPTQAIPKVLDHLSRNARPPGVSPNGVAFRVPSYIGDARVARGRITLYKTTGRSKTVEADSAGARDDSPMNAPR
jgi:hypothetical protein